MLATSRAFTARFVYLRQHIMAEGTTLSSWEFAFLPVRLHFLRRKNPQQGQLLDLDGEKKTVPSSTNFQKKNFNVHFSLSHLVTYRVCQFNRYRKTSKLFIPVSLLWDTWYARSGKATMKTI